MREEEAKTKWCPFVRALPLGPDQTYGRSVTTRDFPPSNERNCIGSNCMAWRRYRPLGKHDEEGFCGLAGREEQPQ